MLLSVEIYDWLNSTVFWLIYTCDGRTDRQMDGRTTACGALAHGRRAMKTEERMDWLRDGRIDGLVDGWWKLHDTNFNHFLTDTSLWQTTQEGQTDGDRI